uniref:Ig-like domain-containing protein n=1 Tax=Ornithorhynchus anatinus TaxID=9258 RepID=F7B4J2_ORNAN
MVSRAQLLCLLLLWAQESNGDIVLTQSPDFLTATPGDQVKINCKASSSVSNDMAWYRQKPGQAPKLLINYGNNRPSGVPDRFSSSGSGTNIIFTISRVETDDGGDYYCQQHNSYPCTVLQPATKTSLGY